MTIKPHTIAGMFILGCCLFAITIISCSGSQTTPAVTPKKSADVRVITVQSSAISRTLDLTGTVEPIRKVHLSSPAEGPVISLTVREGDFVRKGDTLLIIGRQEGVTAQISSLREDVRKEEGNLARAQRLAEMDGISKEQLDQVKAAYERAKALLIRGQELLRDYSVVAPWEAIVSHLLVEVGDYVTPREPLLEIFDPTSLVIRVNVPEKFTTQLKRTAPVIVSLDAYPDSVFNAAISRIYPYLDERMRTRTVEIRLVDAVDLLPGMFARIKLQSGTIDSAIVIPAQALTVTPEASKVVFVVANGKAVQRTVQTGIEEVDRVQVIGGIQLGDSLIVSGVTGLSDGKSVHIVDNVPTKTELQASTAKVADSAPTTKSPDGAK